MSEDQKKETLFIFSTGIIALLLLILIVSCFFQLLWNNTLIFAVSVVNPISFWQSYGILFMIYFSGRIFCLDFSKK
jgi:hypothetical protein